MNISRIACVAVSLGMLGASSAFAAGTFSMDEGGRFEKQTINVLYPDLNLAKTKDARILYMRLESAAREICGDAFDAGSLYERNEVDQCQKDAIAGAVTKVNQPLLTAIYEKHYDSERAQG